MRLKTIIIALIKLGVAFGALAYVFSRIDTQKMLGHFQAADAGELAIIALLVTLAYIASALRMRYYFRQAGVRMRTGFALMLFYVSAFFNYVLPGGIGGDGYRIYFLSRNTELKPLKVTQLIVGDRLSGLYVLALFCLAGSMIILQRAGLGMWQAILLSCIITGSLAYFYVAGKLLGQGWKMSLGAIPYSFAIQFFSTLLFLSIFYASEHRDWALEYTVIFMIAYIVGILPVSIGGLGIRELVCYWGAGWMQHTLGIPLDAELAIALSLAFFFVSLLAALPAIPFFFMLSRDKSIVTQS